MSDRVMFISWGSVARGSEARALEVFNESVGYYGRLQQDGRIESFDVTLLDPNGDINGYIQLHGSAEQLAALKMDDEYRRVLLAASMIVDDMRQIEGSTNEGVARNMAMFQEAIAQIPQRAWVTSGPEPYAGPSGVPVKVPTGAPQNFSWTP